MSLGAIPQELIGAIDDWLIKQGKGNLIGAGGTPMPTPVTNAPARLGATPPFLPEAGGAPTKIGSSTGEQPRAVPFTAPSGYEKEYRTWESQEPAPYKRPPTQGFLGKVGRFGEDVLGGMLSMSTSPGAQRIGQSMLYPGKAEADQQYSRWGNRGKQIGEEQRIGAGESENTLRVAQADEAMARAEEARHPKADTKAELPAETQAWLAGNPGKTIQDYWTAKAKAEAAGKPDTGGKTLDEQYDQAVKTGDTARAAQLKGEMATIAAARRDPAQKAPPQETAFDKATAEAASKDVETARGGDFRYRSMAGSFPKAQKGDQQAMVNLLTNHIGMTLGMQKGARITKDILNEAQKSAPWLQGVKARWDSQGYLSGVVLTPDQMQQMMDLATQQRANAWAQAVESARQGGVAEKLKIPSDVRIRVTSPDGKTGTIPGSQLAAAEDQGYVVSPQ